MEETLLPVGTSYTEVYASFCWQLPTTFNIGVDVCDRHADDPSRLAMVYEDDTGLRVARRSVQKSAAGRERHSVLLRMKAMPRQR